MPYSWPLRRPIRALSLTLSFTGEENSPRSQWAGTSGPGSWKNQSPALDSSTRPSMGTPASLNPCHGSASPSVK